jgi:DNA-binding NtrC family response regulator
MPAPPPKTDTQKMSAPSERDKILAALAACAGNQSRAAEMLGMPRRTFVNKLDAYDIPRPKKRRDETTES